MAAAITTQHLLQEEDFFGGSGSPLLQNDIECDSINRRGRRNRVAPTDTIPLTAENQQAERLSPLQSYQNRKLYGLNSDVSKESKSNANDTLS